MLIINVDDWGRSAAETDAALRVYRARRITRVSAMVYMRDSKRAAKLAVETELTVGLHLNFSEQFTDPRCPDKLRKYQHRLARFLRWNRYASLVYNPFLRKAFADSFRAQWYEFIHLYRRPPAHIDGHHHMHLCANVLFSKLVPNGMTVRRNFSFPAGEKSWLNRTYRDLVDRRLARSYNLSGYFFDLTQCMEEGKLDRVMELAQSNNVELMTHPVSLKEAEYLMSDEFGGVLERHELENHVLLSGH
jgi:chitin disaccharide deacetylase